MGARVELSTTYRDTPHTPVCVEGAGLEDIAANRHYSAHYTGQGSHCIIQKDVRVATYRGISHHRRCGSAHSYIIHFLFLFLFLIWVFLGSSCS